MDNVRKRQRSMRPRKHVFSVATVTQAGAAFVAAANVQSQSSE